jgi:hypothetical protein
LLPTAATSRHESLACGASRRVYALGSPAGSSNPLFVQFATAPVLLEAEPNNEPGKAQKITVPGEFAGQFQSTGDVDHLEFEAKAGEVFYLEVFAERHGTTADPYLTLDQVTKNDKGEEKKRRSPLGDRRERRRKRLRHPLR